MKWFWAKRKQDEVHCAHRTEDWRQEVGTFSTGDSPYWIMRCACGEQMAVFHVITPKSGDILELRTPKSLTYDEALVLAEHLKSGLPEDVKVVVMGGGSSLTARSAEN